MLGKISTRTMRHLRSPSSSADSTNSRVLSDSVCVRIVRADQPQPVAASTAPMTNGLASSTSVAMTIMRGKPGSTSTTLTKKVMISSIRPPKYPAEMPSARPIAAAATPAKKPTPRLTRPA
jgi:hypothetical protein